MCLNSLHTWPESRRRKKPDQGGKRKGGAERGKGKEKKEEEEGSGKCARGGMNRRESLRGIKEGMSPPPPVCDPPAQFSMCVSTVCTRVSLFAPRLRLPLPLSFPLNQQLLSARRQSWLPGLLNCPHFSGFVRSRGKMRKNNVDLSPL